MRKEGRNKKQWMAYRKGEHTEKRKTEHKADIDMPAACSENDFD